MEEKRDALQADLDTSGIAEELSDDALEDLAGGVAGQAGGSCTCKYCGMTFADAKQMSLHVVKVHLGK